MNKNYIPKEAAAIDLLGKIKTWVNSDTGKELLKRGLIGAGTGLGVYAGTGLLDSKSKHQGKRAIGSILAGLLAGWKGEDAAKAIARSYKDWAAARALAKEQERAVGAAQVKGSVAAMKNRVIPAAGDMQELAGEIANQAINADRAQDRQNDTTRKNMAAGEEREWKERAAAEPNAI